MSVRVFCSACGRQYNNLKEELRGKKVRCKCGIEIRVPEENADDIFTQPLPAAQPIAAPTYARPPSTQKPKRAKRRKSDKGEFRPIDLLYMVVGGIAFVFGMMSVLGILGSLFALPAVMALPQGAPGGSPNFMTGLMASMALNLLSSVVTALLGFFAGAMGYYVYEKRRLGKSEYGWAFGYSAIAAAASILVSLLLGVYWMIRLSSISSATGAPIGVSYLPLFLTPLPFVVLVLYAIRSQLGFKELEG